MAIGLAELLKNNNNETNQVLSLLSGYTNDRNNKALARGGLAPEVWAWYDSMAGGRTSEQLAKASFGSASQLASEQAMYKAGTALNVNPTNDPAQIAYNQRLAAMPPPTPVSIQQGIAGLGGDTTRNTTYQGGEMMPARNPDGSLASTTMSTSNIGATPVKVPGGIVGNSTADATAAGGESSLKSIQEYINLLTPPTTKDSNSAQALRDQISGDLKSLEGRGDAQLRAEQEQQVQQKKQTLQNYQAELLTKTSEYKAIQARYQALNAEVEGKPITLNSIIGSQAQVNRVMQSELNVKASEIGMVAANVAAAQGNVELAQSTADRAVDLRYQDTLDAINIRQQQLSLLEGELDKKESIRAQAIQMYLADQQSQVNERKTAEKELSSFNIDAMSQYPSAGIKVSDSYETTQRKITGSAEYRTEIASTQALTAQRTGGGASGGGSSAGGFEEQISDLKLSTAQKGDLVDIQTLGTQIADLESLAADGILEGIGGLGLGSAKQFAFKTFGQGSDEGARVRTTIGNIKGQIAKLRGGTSFTANEEKLLDSYVPGINESTVSVLAKLAGLKRFLESKQSAIISVGGGFTSGGSNDPLQVR